MCDQIARPATDDMPMLRLVAREHVGPTVFPPIVVKDHPGTGEWVGSNDCRA